MAIDPNMVTEKVLDILLNYGPKFILAILTLIIGFWIIKVIGRVTDKLMIRKKVDKTLQPFLHNIAVISLKVMLLISVAGMVGIQVTSFIAVLGAAGLAIGLALQGSLANFAGGVLILMFKPYQVDDFIKAQGVSGTVKEIQIFNTILKTLDNSIISVPNGAMANGNIKNYSKEPERQVEWVFGIGYNDNVQKAREIIVALLKKDKRVLKNKDIKVLLAELGESSVNLKVRAWTKNEDYWSLFFDMQEWVKLSFDKNKISFPYPQQDVHIHK